MHKSIICVTSTSSIRKDTGEVSTSIQAEYVLAGLEGIDQDVVNPTPWGWITQSIRYKVVTTP